MTGGHPPLERTRQRMQELKESEFEEKTSGGVVLVDFTAEWCGPCRTLSPILQRVSAQYDGRLHVFSVDIDEWPSLAARHGVMSVPTVLLFREGQQVDRMVGVLSEGELKKRIEVHLGAGG
ncbi:MAG TPA: thioredoxin [Thermoanaerobaculia bacterium]|nr:thioredoxin [Thermoanaerobaculia bacterium]